jgi:calcineurin-like phosphoesterase
VQTADEQVLPGGTAYITDVGMTGPHDGIIGVDRDAALGRFLTALPARFESAGGTPKLHAIVIEVDAGNGRATAVTRLSLGRADIDSLRGD